MKRLFISDLHLDEKRPDIFRAFLHFLNQHAAQADELYILGDLFETWIGDDDNSEFADVTKQALHALTGADTTLYFMHGNRDFLLGEQFARDTGGILLQDPHIINIDGADTLLMHGDSLCTRDTDYMQLRQQLRSTQWQKDLLSKTLAVRRNLANELRMASTIANSNKAEDITDVTPEAVIRVLEHHNCRRLIHGHTHRPARHALELNGQAAERIVLGDWDSHLWYLASEPGRLILLKHPIGSC